jgi:hypothetical protein
MALLRRRVPAILPPSEENGGFSMPILQVRITASIEQDAQQFGVFPLRGSEQGRDAQSGDQYKGVVELPLNGRVYSVFALLTTGVLDARPIAAWADARQDKIVDRR